MGLNGNFTFFVGRLGRGVVLFDLLNGLESAVFGVFGVHFEVEGGDCHGIGAHELPHVGGGESDEGVFDFVDGV